MATVIGADDKGEGAGDRSPSLRDRRNVTVLFADIVGSTALIEGMDVEGAWGVLMPVLDLMVRAVERYSGTVINRLGDGIMAIFGIPVMLEDHALHACHAALAIQEDVRALAQRWAAPQAPDLKLRIGINSGPILVTEVTDSARTSYDAVGATVHLASRVQSAAEPGTICLSEHSLRLVRQQFLCRPLGAKPMKGFKEPQPIHELLRWQPSGAKRGLHDYALESPLVGRADDLAVLAQALERLARGEGGVVLMTGEAGIGKSRLLAEARTACPAAVLWLEGRSLSFSQGISFWPFMEMLKPLIEQIGAAADTSRPALESALDALLGEEASDVLPYLAMLLGAEAGQREQRLRGLSAEVLGAQIFRACRRLFETLARRSPVLVAFEDLHFADASSRALLAHLLPLAASLPLLFVVLSRPDASFAEPLRAAASEALNGRFIERPLMPLSQRDCRTLLAAVLGEDERLASMRDLILAKADGNPFFIEEVIRALIDTQVLTRDAATGAWELRSHAITIPDTIQGVVMARVDRLDNRMKDVLGIAAILGRTFLYRVLRAVTAPEQEIETALSRLVAIQLVEQMLAAPERAYAFRHALAHDCVYESLLLQTRRMLHGRVGDCLEELYAGRLHEVASLLAFHFVRAEKWDKAKRYLLAAADQSSQVAADDEALGLYEQAVEAFGRAQGQEWNRVQRATIDRQLGEIYFRRGEHHKASQHLIAAIGRFGDKLPAGRWATRIAIGRAAFRHLRQMLLPGLFTGALADRFDDESQARLRPYEVLGWIYFLSDQERLLLVTLEAANLAHEIGAAEAVAKSLAALGLGIGFAGYRRLAARYHARAGAIAERFGPPLTRAFVQELTGAHAFCAGDWPKAEQCFLSARRIAGELGDLLIWSDATVLLCELLNERGEFERVLKTADEMLRLGREAAFRPALCWGLMARGKALRRLGRTDEALPVLEEGLELSTSTRDLVSASAAAADLGLLLIEQGRLDLAESRMQAVDRQVKATKITVFTVGWLDAALAECALRRAEIEGGRNRSQLHAADRACRVAAASARVYGVSRPASLRLAARRSLLHGRPRAAERLWRRAAASAVQIGAAYELERVQRDSKMRDLAAAQIES
jgi:class 3 adenylate cyclase/tetratricopeptide (TPR) repeat protein